MPPVAPDTVPARVITALLRHTKLLAPALTAGAVVKARITGLDTAKQLPLPVVVRVRVTDPLAISEGVGEYVAAKLVVLGLNPPPPPLHTPPVATVTLPLRDAEALLAHNDWPAPAVAVGAAVMLKVT